MVVRTLDYHAEGMGSNSTLDNVTICKFFLQNESKVVDPAFNLPRIKNLVKKLSFRKVPIGVLMYQ